MTQYGGNGRIFAEVTIWLLHHDDTPAHSARIVQDFLVKHDVLQLRHPPYSPDLVPCDFSSFPKLREPSKGRGFDDIDATKQNATQQLLAIKEKDFQDCFEKWIDREKKVTESKGNCSEGYVVEITPEWGYVLKYKQRSDTFGTALVHESRFSSALKISFGRKSQSEIPRRVPTGETKRRRRRESEREREREKEREKDRNVRAKSIQRNQTRGENERECRRVKFIALLL